MKELSDQTRAAIFFGCAILIFLVWSHFFLPATPTPSQLAQKSSSPQANAVSQSNANATMSAAPTAAAVKPTPAMQAAAETSTVVQTPVYRVQLSNRGGVVTSWQLMKYFDNQAKEQPLDLINADSAKELGWPLSLSLQDPTLEAEANSALYQITPATSAVEAPASVALQWSDGHLSVTKKLTFASGYDTDVEASVMLDGKPIPFTMAWRGQFGDKAVYQAPQMVTVFYSQAGKLNTLLYRKLGAAGNQIQPTDQGGSMEFAGIEDSFFAAAFIPKNSDMSLWHWTQWHHYTDGNNQPAFDPEAQIGVGPTAPGPFEATLFIGPKDLQILGQQTPSLEGLINFGWTGVIAKPLLFALQYLHKYISNYGWVIVIFTLLLNTLLFPVKMWSFKSARKMQQVGPEIKAIQDRYKKYSMRDPRKQKMNEEVMAVYQREGINPASGCLPMIPQLIVLWAFWRVLAYSIILRHEPWIGWIHDLSARDPYYILPIGMAVTAYLMQRLTPMPSTIDPAQQRMMMLMPLFFVVLLFRYASGLNLYYFTANLVGAAQQWYLTRSQPLPSRSKFKKNRE